MRLPVRLLRRLLGRVRRAGAWAVVLVFQTDLSASQALQLVTMVVTISVPATAFDPTTGKADVTIPRGLVLQVQSSNSWRLGLRAVRAYFVNEAAVGDTKSVSELQLRNADGGAIYVPSVASVEIARGGNTHGYVEYAFDVILQATTADPAGVYSVNLEFNLH